MILKWKYVHTGNKHKQININKELKLDKLEFGLFTGSGLNNVYKYSVGILYFLFFL